MRGREVVALFLIIALAGPVPACAPPAAEDQPRTREEQLRQRAEMFGVGAEMRAYLHNGQVLRGRITSLSEAALVLDPGKGTGTRTITYKELGHLEYARTRYLRSGAGDPAEARRIALSMRPQRHIYVASEGREGIRGRMVRAEPDRLVVAAGKSAAEVGVPYSQILELKGRHGPASKALWIGVGCSAVLVIAVVAWVSQSIN